MKKIVCIIIAVLMLATSASVLADNGKGNKNGQSNDLRSSSGQNNDSEGRKGDDSRLENQNDENKNGEDKNDEDKNDNNQNGNNKNDKNENAKNQNCKDKNDKFENGMYITVNDSRTGTGLLKFNYVNSGSVSDWVYAPQVGAYMDDIHTTVAQSAYCEFRFNGTQIKFYGAAGPDQGTIAFSMDGGIETVVDAYAVSRADNVLLYTSPVLARTAHVLKIRATGLKNASSTSAKITIDRVEVMKSFLKLGTIKGKVAKAPAGVVLNELGILDWVHWGYTDVAGFNRKAAVTAQISNYIKIGSGTVLWQSATPVLFSWTGGTPTAAAANNSSAIYIAGKSNGFQITVPAGTAEKTLTIYLGVLYSKVDVEASISDNSVKVYKTTIDAKKSGQAYKVLTLKYKAAIDAQTLTVKLTTKKDYNPALSRIILQAAALN